MSANTSVIFGGRRAKLLTADGLLRRDGSIGDFDGPINLIPNGHFEVDARGWAAYQNTPGVVPVTGAGGAPTISITRSLSAPLMGIASGLIIKDANNRQGEGIAFQFTAPEATINQTLSISFDYKNSAGYTGSGTEFINVYIYDVTNAAIITPNLIQLPSAAGINSSFSASFSATTGTVYRLCLHIAGTGSVAWTMNIDNVEISKFSASGSAPVVAFANRAQLTVPLGLLRQDGSVSDFEGIVNAVPNGHFEVNANGWNTYADAPGPAPVDGTGGSAAVTIARTTSGPLVGVGSGLFTKDANNRQGQGTSYDFTLPKGMEGIECAIEALVSVTSNYTGPTGTEYLAAYIYDVTNNVLVTPTSPAILGSGRFSVRFTAPTNSTSYRLIFHVASTGVLAWTALVDDIRVGIADPSVLVNYNVRANEGGGTVTLTSYDKQGQVFNLTAAETVVLPSASIKKGDVLQIAERGGAFNLIIQASDFSVVETVNGSSAKLLALIDTPVTNTDWKILSDVQIPAQSQNYLFNAGFDVIQRGGGISLANSVVAYGIDRWYGQNNAGVGSTVILSAGSSTDPGSFRDLTVEVTVAPSAPSGAAGLLYQVLDNQTARRLYNQTCSAQGRIRAIGNVTQVGLQLMYATSEVKLTTTIGPEVLTTINTGSITTCTILNQAMGTAMTMAGVVGLRIRATAVSSGDLSDAGNGIECDKMGLWIGPPPTIWQRMYPDIENEKHACRRFYETSYRDGVFPGAVVPFGSSSGGGHDYGALVWSDGVKMVEKRIINPVINIYEPGGTIASQLTYKTGGTSVVDGALAVNITASKFVIQNSNSYSLNECDWAAEAEI